MRVGPTTKRKKKLRSRSFGSQPSVSHVNPEARQRRCLLVTRSHTFLPLSLSTKEDGTRTLTSSWTTDVKDFKRSQAKSRDQMTCPIWTHKVAIKSWSSATKKLKNIYMVFIRRRRRRRGGGEKVWIEVLSTRLEKRERDRDISRNRSEWGSKSSISTFPFPCISFKNNRTDKRKMGRISRVRI